MDVAIFLKVEVVKLMNGHFILIFFFESSDYEMQICESVAKWTKTVFKEQIIEMCVGVVGYEISGKRTDQYR